jgi:hypothetical protein
MDDLTPETVEAEAPVVEEKKKPAKKPVASSRTEAARAVVLAKLAAKKP